MLILDLKFVIPVDEPVAQLDRALPSGGKGQRFESSRARHISTNYRYKGRYHPLLAIPDCAGKTY